MEPKIKVTDKFGNHMGETLLPELDSAVDVHVARYRWALDSSSGRILDVGCGIGYGSPILLRRCLEYVGFDYHPARRLRAEADYADDRATFLTHDANDPFPFEDESFHIAVCFEAIEHIASDRFAIGEIWRVLEPGGKFFCSTPVNRGQNKGHYHIREYTVEEFKNLIGSHFDDVQYFGQPHSINIGEILVKHTYICCKASKAES